MSAALRPRPELEADEDGLLWADLWISIAFVLFVLVTDPATSWLLSDTRLQTEGTRAAPGSVLTLHLVADPAGTPVLREATATGPVLDDASLAARLGTLLEEDPDTTVVLSVGTTLPAGAVLETAARIEQAGIPSITLAQSIQGD